VLRECGVALTRFHLGEGSAALDLRRVLCERGVALLPTHFGE
jgi:hypothetical protein